MTISHYPTGRKAFSTCPIIDHGQWLRANSESGSGIPCHRFALESLQLTVWTDTRELRRGAASGAERRFSVMVDDRLMAGSSEEQQTAARESASLLLSLPWELLDDGRGYLFQGNHSVRVRRRCPAVFHGGAQLSVLAAMLNPTGQDFEAAQRLAAALIEVGLAQAMPYGHLQLDPALKTFDQMGRLEEAVAFCRQAAEIAVQLRDKWKEGLRRSNLANTLTSQNAGGQAPRDPRQRPRSGARGRSESDF